mgnify:CR=1 FL=1
MNTEGKHIWAALCKAGATEEDRAEAADQRAQADEEKAEAERNIAEADQLKEGASIRAALGFPKDALWPSDAIQITNNAIVRHQNSQTMSEEDEEESQIEITLKEIDGETELTLTHSMVPESGEHYIKGWDEHYFQPMKAYFEYRK